MAYTNPECIQNGSDMGNHCVFPPVDCHAPWGLEGSR